MSMVVQCKSAQIAFFTVISPVIVISIRDKRFPGGSIISVGSFEGGQASELGQRLKMGEVYQLVGEWP